MVTDTEKMEAVIDDAYILITDKKIASIQEILPLLEEIVKAGKKDVYKRQVNWFNVIGIIAAAAVANFLQWGIAAVNAMVVAAIFFCIGELTGANK